MPLPLAVVPLLAHPARQDEPTIEDEISAKLRAGQIDAALEEARAAVGRFPNSSQIHQLLGAALFKKGLNADAREAFRLAIELAPGLPQNYYNLALIELSEKRYAEATTPLERYLRLNPENAEAHLLLGRAYHNLNRTLAAIDQFKKAISLQPHLPLAHYHLGYAYQSQGNLKEALDEFKQEAEYNPRFYDSYWLAGNIELGALSLDAAEKLFRDGIKVKPQAYQAHYGLGRVLLTRKQFPAAEAELKHALESNPNHLETHYALGRVYQQMGSTEDAQREFEVCSRLNAQRQKMQSGIAGQNP